MSGTRQQLTDAACQSIILLVCVWNPTQLFFIRVKACTSTPMSLTRQHFTDAACQSRIPPVCVSNHTQLFFSLSKPVPRPPCLELDNISLMRPVKAEFLLFCLVTPLCSAGHCKKSMVSDCCLGASDGG